MKKLLAILLTLSMLLAVLCSCNSKEISLYDTCICDAATDGLVDIEYKSWLGLELYAPKENIPDKTIIFEGTEYSGVYKRSKVFGSYTLDRYLDQERRCEFYLKEGTNDFAGISFSLNDDNMDGNITEASAVSFAKELVCRYISNIDEYEQQVGTHYSRLTGKINYYGIKFVKKIDGYETADRIVVAVSPNGNLRSFMLYDIDSFEGKNIDFDDEILEKSIENKLKETYEKRNLLIKDILSQDKRIVLTPEGRVAIRTNISLMVENSTTNEEQETLISLLTYLENAK